MQEHVKFRISTNNFDVHVLSRINELAQRCGLRASEISAYIKRTEGETIPSLELPSIPNSAEKMVKFHKMLSLLGCEEGCLRATEATIEDRIENAINQCPRASRFL